MKKKNINEKFNNIKNNYANEVLFAYVLYEYLFKNDKVVYKEDTIKTYVSTELTSFSQHTKINRVKFYEVFNTLKP